MADKNVPSAEKKNSKLKAVESKQKNEKKEKLSFKKLITIIIIVVLALLMIGGVYYVVVLVSQSKAEKANSWGSYAGQSILIENNNVFYNTLVNDSNLQTAYLNGDYNTLLSSYYGAYQAQVAYMALSKDAKEAGIVAPQDLVNDLIIRSGVYNDENGIYSADVFNASSESERIAVNTYYTNFYPYTAVLSDLQSAIVSKEELSFVENLSKNTRSFEYFIINYLAYPNELAEAYGKENAEQFRQANISVISCATEDKIIAAYEALQAGDAWNTVVATYSEDSYAENAGLIEDLALFSIVPNMSDPESIEIIKALEVGQYTAPIQSPYGYTIYRLDSEIHDPDFSDPETLAAVKYYINQNNPDEILPYIDAAVANVPAQAQTDFEGAANSINSEIVTIASVSNNIGGSQYLGGISSYDSYGYLASEAEDESISRELFTADEGYVTAALAVADVENTYIVVKVDTVEDNNTSNAYVTTMLYNYYAAQQPAYDRIYNAFASNLHVNNFYNQFFATLFSSST